MATSLVPYDPEADDNSAANSYVSRAEIVAYAGLRGLTFADEDASDKYAIQGMDYLEAQASRYKGEVTDFDQKFQWPRTGVWFNGAYQTSDMFPDDEIPQRLKDAQCALACVAASGVSFYPVSSSPGVKARKVDVIEREFFQPGTPGGGSSDGTPTMPGIDALLAPLFDTGGDFTLEVVRA